MTPKETKESAGSNGKLTESIETQIRRELEKRTPWNLIAQRYHVSSKTISKIRDGEAAKSQREGEIAAAAFTLFERGVGVVGAVIELKQPPEVIERYYEKWVEQKGQVLFPRQVRDRILMVISSRTHFAVSDPVSLAGAIDHLVGSYLALCKFQYPCPSCKKAIRAGPELEWKWLVENGYLSQWGHKECVEQINRRQEEEQRQEQQRLQERRRQEEASEEYWRTHRVREIGEF